METEKYRSPIRFSNNGILRWVIIFYFLLIPAACLNAQGIPVQIERLSEREWRLTITNSSPRILQPRETGEYSKVMMPGYSIQIEEGKPQLPFKRFAFAVPFDGEITFSLTKYEEERQQAELTPFVFPRESRSTEITSDQIQSDTQYYIRTGNPRFLDGLREESVEFTPVMYNLNSKEIIWLRTAIIDIRISGTILTTPVASQLAFSKWGLLNHEDANRMPRKTIEKPYSRKWFSSAGSQMLRISTLEQGMFRIAQSELFTIGVQTSTIDPRTFKILSQGEELPIYVEGEDDGRFDENDYIEFFAPRKKGANNEWYDLWSDENIFFLQWDGANGRRFDVEEAAPTVQPIIQSYINRVHLEEDKLYHAGDSDFDANSTEFIPGENWIWKYLLKKDSLKIPFTINHLAGGDGKLVFRAKASSRDPSRLITVVNDSEIVRFDMNGRESVLKSVSLPDGVLKAGLNTVSIHNPGIVDCPPVDPNCTIERFYIDWIEVHYPNSLRAQSDEYHFDASVGYDSLQLPQQVRCNIKGFSSQQIRGINLSRGKWLSGFEIISDGAEYKISTALWNSDSYYFYSDVTVGKARSLELISKPDLSKQALDVDYIIITHKNFRQPAERITQYRQSSDGFQVFIAYVDDIYNEFAFGHKNPEAIRNFLKHVYVNSNNLKPRFVLLLGDASWDPKFLLPTSFKIDFVPAFGNPVSDNFYVAFGDFPSDVTPSMHIGRIPAETSEDANYVINKIIEYENAPLQEWNNRILLSVGGKDPIEQERFFKPYIKKLTANLVDPYCLESRTIIKKRLDFVSYEDLDTLISEVNNGVLWFYFLGHGGTRIIDVGVERPDIFDVKGKYPFFITMSCNTAHYGEPFETGLNERFVMAVENGSISSFGTSGLGVVGYDEVLSDGLFEGLVQKEYRTYGELATRGKNKLIEATGTSNQITRNTVNQYALLGDPATRLPLATTAELMVNIQDIRTSPDVLIEQTPAVIKTTLHNIGLCLNDSVDVVLRIEHYGKTIHESRKRIPSFLHTVEIDWEYNFAGIIGPVYIELHIDPENLIVEKTKQNNKSRALKNVLPRGITQIFPLDNAIHPISPQTSISFVLANPSNVPELSEIPQIELEISDDPKFQQILRKLKQPPGQVFTWLDWTPQEIQNPSVVFWRARMTKQSGNEEWSNTRSICFETNSVLSDVWKQTDSAQFAADSRISVHITPDGSCELGTRTIELETLSAGSNQVEIITAVLRVNGVDYSYAYRGFNIAEIEPVTGKVVDVRTFDTYMGQSIAAEMTGYLNAIPSDHTIMLAVKDDANGYPPVIPEGTNVTPELRSTLKGFGAKLIDSVGFQDSYAFIGSKRAPEQAREMHSKYGIAYLSDQIDVMTMEGILRSIPIGPANEWISFSWSGALSSAASNVKINIRSVPQDSMLISVSDIVPGTLVDLSSVSASSHPYLRVEAILNDTTGMQGPRIDDWSVVYKSIFPEVGINSQVVYMEADSVLEGEQLLVRADVYNAGRVEANSVSVKISLPENRGGHSQTIILPRIDVSRERGERVEFALPTAGMTGEMAFDLTVNGEATIQEYYSGNNIFSRKFLSKKDRTRPRLLVAFDGAEIINNDYVSPNPVIDISLRDESPLIVTDTSSVQVFLDGRRIWLITNPIVQYSSGGTGEEKIKIQYTPELKSGTHTLAVSGKDASGNLADTIPYQVRFLVSAEEKLENVFAFPNPTSGPMDFTFRLLGSIVPDDGSIKIYSLAGRLIHEIHLRRENFRIGFNRVYWDSRDREGAPIANGVYFFKLALNRNGKTEEHVGRLAILR